MLEECTFGNESMCGRCHFNAIFSSLPNLRVMKVASDSWVDCSVLYEYQVNHGDFQIGYAAFNSIRAHYLLLRDPFPNHSVNQGELISDQGGNGEECGEDKGERCLANEELKEGEGEGERKERRFAFNLDLQYHYEQSTVEWISPQSDFELPLLTQRGSLVIAPSTMNYCTTVPLSQLSHLEKIEVNDSAFLNITNWFISKLPYLRTIIIKNYVGFRESKPSYLKNMVDDPIGIQTHKHFVIEECEQLETIVIGGGCFCDYDRFELKSKLSFLDDL